MLQNNREKHYAQEQVNRAKFNDMRKNITTNIKINRDSIHKRNNSTFVETKAQTRVYKDIIVANKDDALKEKQEQYKAGKVKWIEGRKKLEDRANSLGAANQNDYATRIKLRMEAANQTKTVSSELEKQE